MNEYEIDELEENLQRMWDNHEKYLQLDEKDTENRAGKFDMDVTLFKAIMKTISNVKNQGR